MNPPVVLVLASGRGERFLASGGSGNKLHALLGDKTVLEHAVAAARASGLAVHVEDAGHEGMGDSIAAAVRATPDAGGWLILPGDLPLVRPDTLRAVANALAHSTVVLPHYRGQRGHPVGFDAACRDALMLLEGAQGAAQVVRACAQSDRLVNLELDDPGIVTDIDTVQDLARARKLISAAAT
ncbi:MAG: nucleotidyltransferase family protein [Ramlibacter sp.]